MKKIFSTLILGSLVIPTFTLALEPLPGKERDIYRQEVLKRVETRDAVRANASATRMQQKEMRPDTRLAASTTRPRIASSTRDNGFCSQIDKILVQIGNGGQTSGEKRTENIEKRDEKRTEVRTEVDTRREENDTKRKSQLSELTRRATTDEQKAAVLAFTTAIEKALLDKKTATDALLAAHRKEVDLVVASRREATDKALATLKADIETAKSKAKADCSNSVTGESVRTTLKDSIQRAQQAFRTTMQSIQKDTASSKREDKKEELKTIEATFKKSVEQARNNLKAAFRKVQPTAASTTSN